MFELRLVTGNRVREWSIEPEPVVRSGGGPRSRDREEAAVVDCVLSWDSMPTKIGVHLDGYAFAVDPNSVVVGGEVYVATPRAYVVPAHDDRTVAELDALRTGRAGRTALQKIGDEPEASFSGAAAWTREMSGPCWLGVGRDIRIFQCGTRGLGAGSIADLQWDTIAPQLHGEPVRLPAAGDRAVRYQYLIGRGIGPGADIERELEDGVLPILHTTMVDGPIHYRSTVVASFERSPLTRASVRGTHYLVSDRHSIGHMLSAEQSADADAREEIPTDEELVAYLRIEATNTEHVPRHAFVKLPAPYADEGREEVPHDYLADIGIGMISGDACFTATVDGVPVSSTDCAVLIAPGGTAVFDIRIPHRPIPRERAEALRLRDFAEVHADVRAHWRDRLATAGTVDVPEKRIRDMFAAGVLHLDLVTYGLQPDDAVAATVGVYTPIGSESAPIIQLFDSVGWADLASRALRYFAERQHPNGFMQNFNGYMLETEAVLWVMGEHFRYTGDVDWVRGAEETIRRAVSYILDARAARITDPSSPYGLMVGKTADDEDNFESFMLNGLAHLALSRAAEMIEGIDAVEAGRWREAARLLRHDLLSAFDDSLAQGPVVPLGDGTWARNAPPWTGSQGLLAFAGGGDSFSHGSFAPRDTLLGPLWLVHSEVLPPDDPRAAEILALQADVFFDGNAAFSQPYYSPHPLIHLRRREPRAFLAAYYTMLASHADRETFSFWEHYYQLTPHKTHEEAQFLMQTRWMLYLEEGDSLRLLPGVPRAWLAPGQRVSVQRMSSYFGVLGFEVEVASDGDRMSILVSFDGTRRPRTVEVRVPHPEGKPIAATTAGEITSDDTIVLPAVADVLRAEVRF